MITMSLLMLGRLLLVLGLAIGLLSWRESVAHIGAVNFLVPASTEGPAHAWYHVFREVCGDVAKMAVFLLLFFGPDRWRMPITWNICAILMVGYYAPFWIGEPFLPALAAPNRIAEGVHIFMACFTILGLVLARPAFFGNEGDAGPAAGPRAVVGRGLRGRSRPSRV